MQRIARALRGTATMAKIPAFAELAAGVERVGRAMQRRRTPLGTGARAARWSPRSTSSKTLLHAARTWSPAEDRARQRANRRARCSIAPTRAVCVRDGSADAVGRDVVLLATEAANIAAGLELLTTRAGDSDTAANVLRRVRALRGVAGVKEIGPLADALEAIEDAARRTRIRRRGLSPRRTPSARDCRRVSPRRRRALCAAAATSTLRRPTRDAFDEACEVWSSGARRPRARRSDRRPVLQRRHERPGRGVAASAHDCVGAVSSGAREPGRTPATGRRPRRVQLPDPATESARPARAAAATAGDRSGGRELRRERRRGVRPRARAGDGDRRLSRPQRARRSRVGAHRARRAWDNVARSAAATSPLVATSPTGIGSGFGRATPPVSAPPSNLRRRRAGHPRPSDDRRPRRRRSSTRASPRSS